MNILVSFPSEYLRHSTLVEERVWGLTSSEVLSQCWFPHCIWVYSMAAYHGIKHGREVCPLCGGQESIGENGEDSGLMNTLKSMHSMT